MIPRRNGDRTRHEVEQASTMDLVGGLVKDTRELVGAHVSAAKLEVKGELQQLGAGLKHAAISAVLFGVGAMLSGIAIAQALIELVGLAGWLSYTLVALAAVGAAVGFLLYARRRAADADAVPDDQIARMKHDAQWLARRASDTARPTH